MIYKIMGNFDNFLSISDELSKYNYIFYHNCLYVFVFYEADYYKIFKSLFGDNCYIQKLDIETIEQNEPKVVIDWYKRQYFLLNEKINAYESQQIINGTLKYLDDIEKIIFKKGRVTSGKEKTWKTSKKA